ncbi:MAG TPA: hypothetical protein VFR87_06890 [Nocardioidaceae bacterium]|nr:hypothetical protein [Nocardioidaceae bacterium]
MSTRVYIPSSTTRLHDLLVSGGLGPVPLLAHAVTPELREALREVGEEEWEYDALVSAAQDSLGLIGEDELPRRVVVVAEADTVTSVEEGEESLVQVDTVIPLVKVVAVHVDSADAADDVSAARGAWAAAQDGDAAAQELLERCLDHELGWYATQEIAGLAEAP